MPPSPPLEITGKLGAQLVAAVFMGNLKASVLQIPLLPLYFMVLMHVLRVVKNREIQGKPLLADTHNVREDGANQLPCHLEIELAGKKYF